jgi:hypothetical protein
VVLEQFETISDEPEWEPRYDIAPHSGRRRHPAASRRPSRKPVNAALGLVPFWAKDSSIAASLINARSETAGTKPAFSDSLKHRRGGMSEPSKDVPISGPYFSDPQCAYCKDLRESQEQLNVETAAPSPEVRGAFHRPSHSRRQLTYDIRQNQADSQQSLSPESAKRLSELLFDSRR